MPTLVTSYNATLAGSVDARARDALTWTIAFRPQALSIYLRFQERGTINTASGDALHLGNSGFTGARLLLRVASGAYRFFHNNGYSEVTATPGSSPTVGQWVELVLRLGANGAVSVVQSINGATATTTSDSAALTIAAAWGGTTLAVGDQIAGGSGGAIGLSHLVIVRGVHDLTAMRKYAATKPVT